MVFLCVFSNRYVLYILRDHEYISLVLITSLLETNYFVHLQESRYNLRSRRSLDVTNTTINQSVLPVNKSKRSFNRRKSLHVTKDKSKENKRKPAFFSSDDEY